MTQQLTENKATVTKVLPTAANKEMNASGNKRFNYLKISVKRRLEHSALGFRNNFFFMVQQSPIGQGLLITQASLSHSDTQHSVGLYWKNDQPDAEGSMQQHTTLTRDKHPCPGRDKNLQSQQASGRTTTPQTARPLGSS
jgi:hypothetical protein